MSHATLNSSLSTGSADSPHHAFDWPRADEAETFLRERLQLFLEHNAFARSLARRMHDETGTDFFEWVDYLVLPSDEEPALRAVGFGREATADVTGTDAAYEHPRATLPRVLVRPGERPGPSLVALRPEFVGDFIARHNLGNEPEGEPFSRYRRLVVSDDGGFRLEAVERRAYRGFAPASLASDQVRALVKARELWQTRPRRFADDREGMRTAHQTLARILELANRDVACHLFFEVERAYWESRNRAAGIQKQRQDQLGLGWGNHDHHTFRCSREHFVDLVDFMLELGFVKRERFYAGAEAGWGAQVLEHTLTGLVVFADVDLLPEETRFDFSTARLPPAPRLGTVGLWVGLHGESLLEAGMHHLEARFEFNSLRRQLQDRGINTMEPFSNFDFLRQAFTEGERWPVRHERAERLLAAGLITSEQFNRFLTEGALGSHLENLQRHGGFKGFNQKSVSAVIAATDPRRAHFGGTPVQA